MNTAKLQAFKAALAELLNEYDAQISCDIDGETFGAVCTMEVDFKVTGHHLESYKLCNGFEVTSEDLKK